MSRPSSPLAWQLSAAAALALLTLTAVPPRANARNLMSADGPGGTYELLRQAYTTELPDCGHMVPHITEEADSELGKPVFVFHAHVNEDDDRCGGTDRQRTEIRARAPDIVANNGETVYYRWKFKLATGFQGTSRFTHIFQIKSDLGAPIMTLTPRVSTFHITGRVSGPTTELAKFIGVWVVVDLKVLYSNSGRVEITIRRVSDGAMLYSHAGPADMWDDNASGHDSKFGIYRSLGERARMRDEQVRFADFCASKVSASECADGAAPPPSDAGVGPAPTDAAAPDAGGNVDTGGGSERSGGAGGNQGAGGTGGSTSTPTPTPTTGGASGSPSPAPRDAAPARPDSRTTPPSGTPEDPEGASAGCGCRVAGATDGAPGGLAGLMILGWLLLRGRRPRPRGWDARAPRLR